MPEAAVAAFEIDGFCRAELNPLGPVQAYVAPVTELAERFSVVVAQIGALLLGQAFTRLTGPVVD